MVSLIVKSMNIPQLSGPHTTLNVIGVNGISRWPTVTQASPLFPQNRASCELAAQVMRRDLP